MDTAEGDKPGDPGRLLIIGGAEVPRLRRCLSASRSCAAGGGPDRGGHHGDRRARPGAGRVPAGVQQARRQARQGAADQRPRRRRQRGRGRACWTTRPASSSAAATSPGCRPWSARGSTTSCATGSRTAWWSPGTSAGATATGPHDDPRRQGRRGVHRHRPHRPRARPDAQDADRHALRRARPAAQAAQRHHARPRPARRRHRREHRRSACDGDSFEVLGSGVVSVVDAPHATVVHAAADDDPITLFDVRLHLLPAGCVFDIASRSPAIGPLTRGTDQPQTGRSDCHPEGAQVQLEYVRHLERPEHLHHRRRSASRGSSSTS